MKLLFFLIILSIFYGTSRQQLHIETIKHENQDPRVGKVERFLAYYHSPLTYMAKDFVRIADRNNLDWRLMVVISCVESSCGKHYQKNAFGWGSDSIDYGDDRTDLTIIANRISSLSYYQTYKKTGNLHDFAVAYNSANSEAYYGKLIYFWEKLK